MDIRDWLKDLGLETYIDAFVDNDIDFEVLTELTGDDLREIGVTSIGHRRKILAAAERLDEDLPALAGETGRGAPAATAQGEEAERRHLTVLFSDLVGSSALSAELDPEEMREVIRAYQKAVAEAVAQVQGYVAQYLGDGIVAYFGYPVAREREQERAVSAGLTIVEAVSRINAPSGHPLAARVGIATGLVVVGDLLNHGEGEVHGVVGETPNLAARLQACGNPGDVIVAAETKRLIEGRFEFESRGHTALKGIPGEVEIWRAAAGSAYSHPAGQNRKLSPLIGRDPEMQLLSGCWSNAIEGQPQLVHIKGEAGIGKSRITEQVVRTAEAAGGTIRRLYCSPFHTSSAYFPIVSFIEQSAGFERIDTPAERLDKLDALMAQNGLSPDTHGALLAQHLSLPADGRYPPLDLAPTALRGRTFSALADLLLGPDPAHPLLLVLEDAHWMDPTTSDFWVHLLTAGEGRHVMFVMTYRSDHEVPKAAGPLRRAEVEIGRLTDRQAEELLVALLNEKPLPEKVTRRILDKADGNPLFVEEICKTVIGSDAIRDAGTHFEIAGSLDEVLIPDTLQDSLMAQLDRLSGVKAVAQVASVIGRRFSLSLLRSLDILPQHALETALVALVDAELIFRSGSEENPIYTFKHALIRDAAYESMLLRRRMGLHAQVAAALEAQGSAGGHADPALIARHYTIAAKPDRAVPFWLQAGKRAMENSAMAEALDHLARGLKQAGDIADETTRQKLEYGLNMSTGFCHISLQGWQAPPVGEHLNAAYELGHQLGERESLLPVIYGLWIHWLNRADFAESQRWIDLAEQEFGAGGSDDWRLIISTMEVIQHRWGGTHSGVTSKSAEVLALYDPAKHGHFVYMFGNDPRVATLGFKSWTSWITGEAETAEKERLACRENSIAVNHPFDRAWQLMVGALTAYFSGRRDAFAASVAEAVELGDRQSVPFVQFILGPVWTGLVHIMDKEWDAAIEIMPKGIGAWEHMGGGVALPFWKSSLGYAMIESGRVEEGRGLIEEAIAIGERTGEYWFLPESYRLLALALSRGKRADRTAAAVALDRAIALAREQGAVAWETRAAQDLAALDHADA